MFVPNVPCGVERGFRSVRDTLYPSLIFLFLMCRVELKVIGEGRHKEAIVPFLMCRVELKDRCPWRFKDSNCG